MRSGRRNTDCKKIIKLKFRDLKRVSEGSDDHGDPRADGNNDGGREPRGEREHPVDDPVTDILHKLPNN